MTRLIFCEVSSAAAALFRWKVPFPNRCRFSDSTRNTLNSKYALDSCRWTLEEGLEVNGCESGAGNTVEDARDKEDPTTLSSMAGQRGLAFSPPRWLLTDGAAELEESGKVSIGAGEGLPPAEILDANGKRRHRKGRGSSIFGENGERDVSMCEPRVIDWHGSHVPN